MTTLEKALLTAAKAFISTYTIAETIKPFDGPRPQQTFGEATETSNEIPVCPRHGKAMRNGKYGYFCTAKEEDPDFANKSGYCNAKVKQ